jgi:hypothetical protein
MWTTIVLGYEASILGNWFLVFQRNISAFETLGSEYPVTRFHISEERNSQPHDLENL